MWTNLNDRPGTVSAMRSGMQASSVEYPPRISHAWNTSFNALIERLHTSAAIGEL
jgi:hypothetical protein